METFVRWRFYLAASLLLHVALVALLALAPEFRPPSPKVYRVRLVAITPPSVPKVSSPKTSAKASPKVPRPSVRPRSAPKKRPKPPGSKSSLLGKKPPSVKKVKKPLSSRTRPSSRSAPKKTRPQKVKKAKKTPKTQPTPQKAPSRSSPPALVDNAQEEAILARRLSQLREKIREREESAHLSAALSRVAKAAAEGDREGLFNRYLSRVTGLIEANLIIPEVIKDPSRLSATVIVVIDARGRLKKFRFEKKSGNRLFDEAVRRAVYLAAPFPPPPARLSPPLEIGVVVRPLRLLREEP